MHGTTNLKYLQVCDFLSFKNEAYCTAMLTFTNRTAHFVLHNRYCSSLPMKWHAGRFLCSTVNMLCGSMDRLLAVWECTEILLYCNRLLAVWQCTEILLYCNRLLAVWQCTKILLYSNRWGWFVNWFKSNCPLISFPPPITHYYPPPQHHHHQILSWSAICFPEMRNVYNACGIKHWPVDVHPASECRKGTSVPVRCMKTYVALAV